MATLDEEKNLKRKQLRIHTGIFLITVSIVIIPYITGLFVQFLDLWDSGMLSHKSTQFDFNYIHNMRTLFQKDIQWQLSGLLLLLAGTYIFLNFFAKKESIEHPGMQMVTPDIWIPKAVGNGEFGTARFATDEEKRRMFTEIIYDGTNEKEFEGRNVGIPVNTKIEKGKENIQFIEEDEHAIIIGNTRSKKGRSIILQYIYFRGLTQKSSIYNDMKKELYLFSAPFLKRIGRKVLKLDFITPQKSMHYNYMMYINEAVDVGDYPKAISYTWDLVTDLVGKPKGEPIWTNGEASVIAAAVLVLACEAPKKYRNLTNVYFFIANMCKENEEGELYLSKYFRTLPETHPARSVFATAELSPDRTRGSFFGSALATLRLFSDWNIAEMTSKSDFDIRDMGKEAIHLFLCLPDSKQSYYPLATLFLSQAYTQLVDVAVMHGGRLPVEVDMMLDEGGQLPFLNFMSSAVSAGASRGIRMIFAIQSYSQLDKTYEKGAKEIEDNCVNTIFLRTSNKDTLKDLSDKLDTYTIQSQGKNSSASSGRSGDSSSSSSSASMTGRKLLFPAEIGHIKRPYTLMLHDGENPCICTLPDVTEYRANAAFGMGKFGESGKKHNIKLLIQREAEDEAHEIKEPELWGIWQQYIPNEQCEREENAPYDWSCFGFTESEEY